MTTTKFPITGTQKSRGNYDKSKISHKQKQSNYMETESVLKQKIEQRKKSNAESTATKLKGYKKHVQERHGKERAEGHRILLLFC